MTKIQKPKKAQSSLLQRYAAAPHILWAILFVIAPLIFVAYYAFTKNVDGTVVFSLDNLKVFFTTDYLIVFGRSVGLALISTIICLLLGYPIAYFISRTKPKTQRLLILLIMLPMWMNFLIRTYAIMVLIQDTGIINSFLGNFGIEPIKILGTEAAVVLGMVYDYLPYMILPIYSVMAKLDYRLVEAAGDLGCNGFKVMRKVILPLTRSGIISGITMVFVPSISTFYISQKLGGPSTLLIGDVIEQSYNSSDYHLAAALSFVLMLILLIGLFIVNKYTDDDGGGVLI